MSNYPKGLFFSDELQKEIKSKFYYVDEDPNIGKRLFFENAGGSLRLKKAVQNFAEVDAIPDCPERVHDMALRLQEIQHKGIEDIKLILNAKKSGSVITNLTASQVMFDMVRAVTENIPGNNIVTTVLEHPSAYDCVHYYAKKSGCEVRIAQSNKKTGGVDPEEIVSYIDKDTVLLNVMYASNITGAIFDIKSIVDLARQVKPDIFIICDAVQHAPHGIIDLEETPVDGINFAPYKFFGCRGIGIGFVSKRLSMLPHNKLSAKPDNVWELGSPAPAHFAVISTIVDYVCWIGEQFSDSQNRRDLFVIGMEHIKLHERALMERLLNGTDWIKGLRKLSNVEVYFDNQNLSMRDLILGIGFNNLEYTQAVREYERRNVIVYDRLVSSLYSGRMLKSFGLEGSVRISPLHSHSKEDIDLFLNITKELTDI